MLISFLAMMATIIGSIVLPTVVMLILPGRKGSMRTVREAAHPLEPQAAWKLYADRGDEEQIVTHATKPMTVEVALREVPGRPAGHGGGVAE